MHVGLRARIHTIEVWGEYDACQASQGVTTGVVRDSTVKSASCIMVLVQYPQRATRMSCARKGMRCHPWHFSFKDGPTLVQMDALR